MTQTGTPDNSILNAQRLSEAVTMLRRTVDEVLRGGYNGRVGLQLHIQDGVIRKPELQRTEFPRF